MNHNQEPGTLDAAPAVPMLDGVAYNVPEMMHRWVFLALGLLSALLLACGGGEEKGAPPATVGRPPVATPGGGLSGTLVWRQAAYVHIGDLASGAVSEMELERLVEAEVGPERLPQEVFRRSAETQWELLTQAAEGWLLWEPLALVEARRQLAERLGVALERVEVRAVGEAEWPDSCLGLPEPGEVCAQVITPGFRIELSAGGEEYEYRSDRGGHVRAAP